MTRCEIAAFPPALDGTSHKYWAPGLAASRGRWDPGTRDTFSSHSPPDVPRCRQTLCLGIRAAWAPGPPGIGGGGGSVKVFNSTRTEGMWQAPPGRLACPHPPTTPFPWPGPWEAEGSEPHLRRPFPWEHQVGARGSSSLDCVDPGGLPGGCGLLGQPS